MVLDGKVLDVARQSRGIIQRTVCVHSRVRNVPELTKRFVCFSQSTSPFMLVCVTWAFLSV
jgi:hypothetical protein